MNCTLQLIMFYFLQKNAELKLKFKDGFKLLFQKVTLKALLISFYILLIQQGGGCNVITTFAETIFEMGNIAISGSMVAIIGGITTLFAGISTPFIVNRFSMKKTFVVTSYIFALTLVIDYY